MDNVGALFPTRRICSVFTGAIAFVYIPIGVCLALLRLCLLLNFIIAELIVGFISPENSGILEIINRIFMAILGIWVKTEGKPLPCNIITCNRRSHIDGIVLSHTLNVCCEDEWGLHSYLCRILKLVKKAKIFENTNSAAGKIKPIIVFPEGSPTSGSGVMKFQTSYFTHVNMIQPCSLRTFRPLPISLSTVHSGFWSDLFWTFFSPATLYSIAFSKKSTCKNDMEPHEFAIAAALDVANILRVPVVEVTLSDKSEYLKKISIRSRGTNHFSDVPPRLLQMAAQVQEVTPHVPRDIILNDLKKTESADITITNILEGVVRFTPIHPKAKKRHEPEKLRQQSPRELLERRKAEMYEMARRRFKEKHGL